MKKRPAVSYFEEWLKENRDKFTHVPKVYKRNKYMLRLRFKDIIPEIEAHVHDNDIAIAVTYHGILWDFLIDFDAAVRKNGKGKFYCCMCDTAHRKYYATESELYREHSFEDFLKWANENLHKSNSLILHGKKEHGSWADIIKSNKQKKYKDGDAEWFVALLSLIKKY